MKKINNYDLDIENKTHHFHATYQRQILGWADAADPSIVNEIGELLDNYKSTSV